MSKMSAAEKKMKEENPSKWRYHYVVKKDPKNWQLEKSMIENITRNEEPTQEKKLRC